MDSLSKSVNILIFTSREEEAEAIVSSLRKGGLPVRATFTDEPDRLEELTETQSFDLILCCEYDPTIDLDNWMGYYGQLNIDLPLVVIAGEETDSGSLIRALRSGARDLSEQGDTDHLRLVVARELSDLSHRRGEQLLQRRLADCERRAKDVVDASGEAVAFIQEGVHVQVNPAYQKMFGFAATEDLDGYPLLDLIAPDDQPKARRILRSLGQLDEDGSEHAELEFMRADASRFRARLVASRSNLDGEPCLRVTVHEIAVESADASSAMLDSETGLPNRSALMGELAARLSRDNTNPRAFAAFYIGLVALPGILRQQGLTAGMEAASEFGGSLREAAPQGSFLARFGDDAFVLLVDGLGEADARRLAAKIAREARVSADRNAANGEAPVCSAGLMLVDPDTYSASELLDRVYRDYLLGIAEPDYEQTAAGRVPRSGSGAGPGSSVDDQILAARISEAIEREGFELAYQPIVSLMGDSQENYNVLLRLRDVDGTLRTAAEFLDAAILSGRIVDVDRWVIRHAVAEVAAKRSQGHKINFFVNLAEETLQQDELLVWICEHLRESQARGNWVTFQVMEEHARRHSAAYTRLAEGLKKVKCRMALNGFGSGPNPELVLHSLSADFVKFAPDLSKNISGDEKIQQHLTELAGLARDAGVRTVVTGVEDARSLTVLWTAGVDYVQGNFLQKPSANIEVQEK